MSFGAGASAPDNSAYENALRDQKVATELAEANAAARKAALDDAWEAARIGKANTLLFEEEEGLAAAKPNTLQGLLGS